MLTLMPKRLLIKLIAVILFFSSQLAQSQSAQDIQKLSDLVNDAVYFTKIFVTPATDAAVYQASNGWMNTPKKAELWDLNVGLHGNVFFVPKSNRTFIVSNSDFKFFKVPGGSATVQTALGSDDQIPLTGNIGGQDVVVKSPEGVSAEAVQYVYLQASLGLWFGIELITKFSPVVKIGNFDYQVYGVGLKHNLDQYMPTLSKNNLRLAAMASYGREDLGVKFLDVQTQYGNLGLNQLTSVIDTYQFQVNFSKQFNKFELGTGLIFNSSNFNYKMGGEPGSIENTIPAQQILNTKLLEVGTTKSNLLAEVSGRYPYRKFFFQATVGIGKFINSNLSVQYKIK